MICLLSDVWKKDYKGNPMQYIANNLKKDSLCLILFTLSLIFFSHLYISDKSYADTPSTPMEDSVDGDDLGDFFSEDAPDSDILEDSDGFFEDTTEDDDLDDFFGDEPGDSEISVDGNVSEHIPDKDAYPEESIFSLKGSVKERMVFNISHKEPDPGETDHRGLSCLKTDVYLELGVDLFKNWDFLISGNGYYDLAYELNGRDGYEKEFLDEYEKELELRKLYIRGSLTRKLDAKIGRQIVVWGESDNIRVTDILNPLDLREPGMVDIEDLRLPVFMSKFDYYWDNWALSTIFIHEHRFNKLPVYGSDFYPLPFPGYDDEIPDNTLENTEFAFSFSGMVKGFEVALYLADIYDDTNFLALDYKENGILPVTNHARIQMVGGALNKTLGNWLFKAESAWFHNMRLSAYQVGQGFLENDQKYQRLDILGGIEFYGFRNTTIGFEAVDRWYINFDDQADKSGANEHNVQYALRASRTFINDTLEAMILASLFGEQADDGGFLRAGLEYDITDSVKTGAGFVLYQSGSAVMLQGIGDNDRIYCDITYSF